MRHKIAVLRPDVIVAAGPMPSLAEDPDPDPRPRIVRLPPSPFVRRKSQGERRAARRAAFRAYFAAATETVRRWRDFDVEPAFLAGCLPPLRLLVGFADPSGRDLGLGIVTECDLAAETITYLIPIDSRAAARLRRGSLLLGEDFSQTSLPR